MAMLQRFAVGFAIALVIALLARRARSLSTSGAVAATVVGAAAMAAGWRWGVLLVAYFVSSSLLSRFRYALKQSRTAGIVEKAGPRDAMQVVANGGVFALCALLAQLHDSTLLTATALGAIAAATADTWATEIGTLAGAEPRSIFTRKPVPRGTSGGVSTTGTVSLVFGALCISLLARALGLTASIPAVLAGGVAGAVMDSILGATLQERRWCAQCQLATEQRVHICGQNTTLTSGREWLDNDLVNLCCTITGAVVAALVASL